MENKELVPVIEIVDGKIQNNLDELETRVKEIAEQHSGLIVDGIPEAKKTVANLRKLYSEINSQKIAAKKVYLAPFEAIEQKVKDFKAILDEPITFIDTQIKHAENEEKDRRRGVIEDLIMDEAKILDDTQARFFHDSAFTEFDPSWTQEKFWTSKGNPTGKLKDDISSRVKMCLDGINTILSVGGEFVDQLLAEFKTSGVLAEVLSSLEAKKEAKRQAEAFVEPQKEPVPEGIVEAPAMVSREDDVPAFMKGPVPAPPADDVPDFMKSTAPEIPQQTVTPAGKQLYTIQMHCTDAQYRRARAAIAMVGVEIL